MENQNNKPQNYKLLYVFLLCSSLLFFLIAALVYKQVIGIFEKDIGWVFVAAGVMDFIAAFIFKSRYNQ